MSLRRTTGLFSNPLFRKEGACHGEGHRAGVDVAGRIHLEGRQQQLLAMLRQTVSDIRVNGSLIRRLPGNLNITIPGTEADELIECLPGSRCHCQWSV
jgi:hypothetical protein